jgi:hypothetical protein
MKHEPMIYQHRLGTNARNLPIQGGFAQTLDMSHLESTFYSAFCLCFYWACRTLSPFLSSGGNRVFRLFFWVRRRVFCAGIL